MIVVPHLPNIYLDGAAMLIPEITSAIWLTLLHDRINRFWFCLGKEILIGLGNALSGGFYVVYYPHLPVLPVYQGKGEADRLHF